MVIDKPQKVEIQKIDSMVVLIWPGDLMLNGWSLKMMSTMLVLGNMIYRTTWPMYLIPNTSLIHTLFTYVLKIEYG